MMEPGAGGRPPSTAARGRLPWPPPCRLQPRLAQSTLEDDLPIDGLGLEDLPLTRHATQGRLAQRLESEVRAGDEVADRLGDDDLTRRRRTHHPRSDVDRDSADTGLAALDLPRVDASPGLKPEIPRRVDEPERAV